MAYQFIQETKDIEDCLVATAAMQCLHDIIPTILANVYKTGAQGCFWGPDFPMPKYAYDNFTNYLPPPEVTVEETVQEYQLTPSLPGTPEYDYDLEYPPSPPPIPVPNKEQCAPSSGPERHGRTCTPPHLKDYTANDACHTAPSHMPSPHSSCTSLPRIHTPDSEGNPLILWEGLEVWDMEKRAQALAMCHVAFHLDDPEYKVKEKLNRCGTCCQQGHFYKDCPVIHYLCMEHTCYVVDTHPNYKTYPCATAAPYVDHLIREEWFNQEE